MTPPTPATEKALDLLTYLSRAYQPIGSIAIGMGESEYRIMQLLAVLRNAGFDVATRLGKVRIRPAGWARCNAAAEAHYDRTHGE